MSEPINGAPVELSDVAGMTLGEVLALTVGDLVSELKAKDVAEDILLLEARSVGGNPPLNICVMVTIDDRGNKYVEAVKDRMRKAAEKRLKAEQEARR